MVKYTLNYEILFLKTLSERGGRERGGFSAENTDEGLKKPVFRNSRKYNQNWLKPMKSGFTLIELLIIAGILAIIAGASAPFFSNYLAQNNFTTSRNDTLSILRKAQSYALDNKGSGDWGVCLSGDNIRLFNGSCAAPVFFEDTALPNNVALGGLTETTFSRLTGEPSGALNLTITAGSRTAAINLNLAGGLEIN